MINYNELYDLLRKEKYSEGLQPMPKTILLDLAEYFKEKKDQMTQENDLFADTVAKSKKQYENTISIFKELIRIRKKKLLSLVFVATETGMMKRDFENMLVFEKELFDKLVKALEDADKEIAKNLNNKETKSQKNKMVLFNQNVEQFIDMNGNSVGPFLSGQLANLDQEVANILVTGGKARLVDEE